MGIFSGKKKHIVGTAVVRVVDDDLIPDTVGLAVTEAIFADKNITHNIVDAALNSSFRKIERAYRWAEEPGNYVYGLPDAKVMSSSDGFEAVVTVLEGIAGGPVVVDYIHFRPINNIHAGKKYARETWGWNHQTNELESLTAYFGGTIPIYLEKMVEVHNAVEGQEPEQSTIGTWDESPISGYTPFRPAQDLASNLQGLVVNQEIRIGPTETESVEMHYVWIDEQGATQRGIHILVLDPLYDMDKEYYQARYTDGAGQLAFWTYDPDTNVYPSLTDVFFDLYVNPGTYFPFVMFRSEDEDRSHESLADTDEYKGAEKLCKYMGMDFAEVGAAIHENPDIDDVDQAIMMLGVPITTQETEQVDYLCRYFAHLYDIIPDPAKDDGSRNLKNYWKRAGTPDESYVVQIQDADFRVLLSFDYITKKYRAGNIEADGGVDGFSNSIHSESAILYLPGVDGLPNTKNRQVRRFRRQITEAVYEEIIVANPQIRYDVYKNKSAVGAAESDILLIPLDYGLSRGMSLWKRERLYLRSLHFIFNSHVVQKVKWYEKGIFKAIITIAAIVIAVWTQQWQLVAAVYATWGAAMAIIVLLINIIVQMAIGLAVQWALSEVASVLGYENTALLAAVLVVAAVYTGQTANASTGVQNMTAQNLLKAATGLVKAASTELQKDMADLLKDQRQFENLMEDSWEELEDAQDLLSTRKLLDPFMFIGEEPLFVAGETPTAYFDRTAHSGNVGVKSLDIVENFVDISLKLPTLDDSVR